MARARQLHSDMPDLLELTRRCRVPQNRFCPDV